MTVDKLQQLVDKTKKDCSDLISKYQKDLENSITKEYDYYLVCNFFDEVFDYANHNWSEDDVNQLLFDSKAMLPMPASVHKQFISALLSTNNLNVLNDLDFEQDIQLDWDAPKLTPKEIEALNTPKKAKQK